MGFTGREPINTNNSSSPTTFNRNLSCLFISRQKDNFIQNKQDWETHWHVYLTNGEEVFDDDGRKDGDISLDPAWLRLKQYCESNGIGIDSMYLRFRSHYEHLEKADGYMFKKGCLGSPGMETRNYFVIGRVVGDKIYVQKWKSPELIVEEEDVRELKDNLEFCILRNQ